MLTDGRDVDKRINLFALLLNIDDIKQQQMETIDWSTKQQPCAASLPCPSLKSRKTRSRRPTLTLIFFSLTAFDCAALVSKQARKPSQQLPSADLQCTSSVQASSMVYLSGSLGLYARHCKCTLLSSIDGISVIELSVLLLS